MEYELLSTAWLNLYEIVTKVDGVASKPESCIFCSIHHILSWTPSNILASHDEWEGSLVSSIYYEDLWEGLDISLAVPLLISSITVVQSTSFGPWGNPETYSLKTRYREKTQAIDSPTGRRKQHLSSGYLECSGSIPPKALIQDVTTSRRHICLQHYPGTHLVSPA